jgi:hypothetical protein
MAAYEALWALLKEYEENFSMAVQSFPASAAE